jgi:hypothetical protein
MDIEQVRAARLEMENQIMAAIMEITMDFHTKTGLSPESIDVQMVDITMIGNHNKRFVVGAVHACVPL